LLQQSKFVAWRPNSIDPPSNEFDTQAPEKALSFPPIWAHLGAMTRFSLYLPPTGKAQTPIWAPALAFRRGVSYLAAVA
jgi:hypothetical protein